MCLIVMTHLLPSLASIAACLTTPPTQKHKKKNPARTDGVSRPINLRGAIVRIGRDGSICNLDATASQLGWRSFFEDFLKICARVFPVASAILSAVSREGFACPLMMRFSATRETPARVAIVFCDGVPPPLK